jgi:hypothetical protein
MIYHSIGRRGALLLIEVWFVSPVLEEIDVMMVLVLV